MMTEKAKQVDVKLSEAIGILISVVDVKGKIAPRDHLIYEILNEVYSKRKKVDDAFVFLSITMPCGQKVEYEKSSDIPFESVPCPCGDPKHWLIKYVERDTASEPDKEAALKEG
jgi:hypothetical protein